MLRRKLPAGSDTQAANAPGPICYLCGLPGADTSEHVVSRCFYIEPLPSDMITLPAHETCNKSTSKDEQWLSVVRATARPVGFGSKERWDKAIRTLRRRESARFKDAFMRSHTPRRDGGADVFIEEPRIYYVLAKMVKGLVHHVTGALLCDHVWLVRKITMETMGKLELPNSIVVHDVACLRWGATDDPPYSLVVWALWRPWTRNDWRHMTFAEWYVVWLEKALDETAK